MGLHFFSPAFKMKLVECVVSQYSNARTIAAVVNVTKCLSKIPVLVRDSPKKSPGFVGTHTVLAQY